MKRVRPKPAARAGGTRAGPRATASTPSRLPPPPARRAGAWKGPLEIVRLLLLGLAAVWFLFEEIGWRPLARWLGRLSAWGPWARAEARIAALPPRSALLLFLVPAVGLLPVKLLALHLMHAGHPMTGIGVIVAAKLVGTAVGGRLYLVLRPTLMQIRRFARAVARYRLTRMRLKAALRLALDWRTMRAGLRRFGRRLRSRAAWRGLGRRWGRALRREGPRRPVPRPRRSFVRPRPKP